MTRWRACATWRWSCWSATASRSSSSSTRAASCGAAGWLDGWMLRVQLRGVHSAQRSRACSTLASSSACLQAAVLAELEWPATDALVWGCCCNPSHTGTPQRPHGRPRGGHHCRQVWRGHRRHGGGERCVRVACGAQPQGSYVRQQQCRQQHRLAGGCAAARRTLLCEPTRSSSRRTWQALTPRTPLLLPLAGAAAACCWLPLLPQRDTPTTRRADEHS